MINCEEKISEMAAEALQRVPDPVGIVVAVLGKGGIVVLGAASKDSGMTDSDTVKKLYEALGKEPSYERGGKLGPLS